MMTESIYSTIPPPIATTHHPAFHALPHIITRDDIQDADGEEEPFTIKCICGYDDDDGNTVYCDKCDTWQHIICFYPADPKAAAKEDFLHKCHECEPRPAKLDPPDARRRQNIQRAEQRRKTETSDADKKTVKKSHKKSKRPSEIVNNHEPERSHGVKKASPAEGHSHQKKHKAHRSHQSVSSYTAKRSPSQNHAHPPSPATTPPDLPQDFQLYELSAQLRDAYENDPGPKPIPSNTFAAVTVISSMSRWATDREHLRQTVQNDTDGIFQILKHGFDYDRVPWPQLRVKTEEISSKDSSLRIKYLESVDGHKNPSMLGELKGNVGFQQDLCVDNDFFTRLSHPPPFVFFHSDLPLYIDTRQEGSQCRYARRSCNPTCGIDTYLMNQSEYHFVLVNENPIAAGTQLTIAWDFHFPNEVRRRYRNLLVPDQTDTSIVPATDITAEEYQYLSWFIRELLSEFGGCACGLGNDCSFVRFHRSFQGKLRSQSNGIKSKKTRKAKSQISPTSTGHATNSREPSEAQNDAEDVDDDSRSTSGSVRSKQQSRDMTPVLGPIVDSGTELTAREKRKIEAMDRRFDEPAKKKKRPSESVPPTNGILPPQPKKQKTKTHGPVPSGQVNGVRYKDASTSRPQDSQPARPLPQDVASPQSRLPSQAPSPVNQSRRPSSTRPVYVDASMQTDASLDTDSWYSPSKRPIPKRRVISLASRLHCARQKTEHLREARRQQEAASRTQMPTAIETQIAAMEAAAAANTARRASALFLHDTISSPVEHAVEGDDIAMHDVSTMSNLTQKFDKAEVRVSNDQASDRPHNRCTPGFKVQIPPTPSFSSSSNGAPPTPSASSMTAQSPYYQASTFSQSVRNTVAAMASPIKKKLSLSDYKARMKKPSATTPLGVDNGNPLDTTSVADEEKTLNSILEGPAVVDSPDVDIKLDPMTGVSSEPKEATAGEEHTNKTEDGRTILPTSS